MIKAIFLDLHEVLVDFVGPACRAWGIERADLMPYWKPGEWGLHTALTRLMQARGHLDAGHQMSLTEFFVPIDRAGVPFWAGLRPCPWAHDVIDAALRFTTSVYVLTSPSPTRPSDSTAGMYECVARHFGNRLAAHCLIPTCHKALLAGPGRVLVDDHDKNVGQWVYSGGAAVVFPQHHNVMHHRAADPVAWTMECLESIRRNPNHGA